MAASSDFRAALREAGGGLVAALAELLVSRLELVGLETREAMVRLIQAVLLTCLASGLLVLGLGLAFLAAVVAVPPQWRAAAAAGAAILALAAGAMTLLRLRCRLARLPELFAATVEAIKKDKACF